MHKPELTYGRIENNTPVRLPGGIKMLRATDELVMQTDRNVRDTMKHKYALKGLSNNCKEAFAL